MSLQTPGLKLNWVSILRLHQQIQVTDHLSVAASAVNTGILVPAFTAYTHASRSFIAAYTCI